MNNPFGNFPSVEKSSKVTKEEAIEIMQGIEEYYKTKKLRRQVCLFIVDSDTGVMTDIVSQNSNREDFITAIHTWVQRNRQ